MKRLLVALALVSGSSVASAQGVFPITGNYRYASVAAEHGVQSCGFQDSVSAGSGTATFLANGTYTYSDSSHDVCQSGTATDSSGSGSGVYVVGPDGMTTLDAGTPDESHVCFGPDLRVAVWAGDSGNQEPFLAVAVKLSSGLGSSTLAGDYHFAKFSFTNNGATTSELWSGTIHVTSPGSFDAQYDDKSMTAAGTSTITNHVVSGATYSVATDGQLTLNGLSGASSLSGVVAADGNMFFALESSGQTVGLLIAVSFASGAGNQLLDGHWCGGNIDAGFGQAPWLPVFCSNSVGVDFDATTASYLTSELEVCQDPTGSGTSTNFGNGTFSVMSDGSACVYEGGVPPCGPGALDRTGSYAFFVDMASTDEFGFACIVRSPPTSIAYCVGDGNGTPCPCANNSPPGVAAGCLNSLGLGGRLTTTGVASIANDSLVLAGSQMPNASALYFQGTNLLNGGLGSVFGDGLRCAGGTVIRLGTKTNSAGASQYPAGGDAPVSQRGLVSAPGTRSYQVWYRNAASFCTPSTFNLTNGVLVIWGA